MLDRVLNNPSWSKYFYIVNYSFRQINTKLTYFLFYQFSFISQFLFTIAIWVITRGQDKHLITYLFIGYVIQKLSWTNVSWPVVNGILNGKIINHLLYPTNYQNYIFAREIGTSSTSNFYSVIVLALFFPFFVNNLQPPSIIFCFLLPVFVSTAFLMSFLLQFTLSCITFWARENINPINSVLATIENVCVGLIIPFQFLPSPLKDILPFNPYAWMLYHPMQIYLGNYNTNQILLTLLGGVGWIITLYFISQLVFKLGLKKYESEGL